MPTKKRMNEKKILNATLTVESVTKISKNFIRILFSSNKIIEVNSDWAAPTIKLCFPLNGLITFPEMNAENKIVWQEGLRERVRTYTMLNHDKASGFITIDFVIHPVGIATNWAQHAKKGDQIGAIRIGSKTCFEAPKKWLFLGDIAALPAISYFLANLPEGHDAQAIVEIRDESDKIKFKNMECAEFILNPNEDPTVLLNALKLVNLSSEMKIIGGMESDKARVIRLYLKENHANLNLDVKLISYWRQGFAEGEFKHID